MKLQELLEMSNTEISVLSGLIQRIFKSLVPVEVVTSGPSQHSHLVDRLTGREAEVTLPEVTSAFTKAKQVAGMELFNIPEDQTQIKWIIKDTESNLNIVVDVFAHPRIPGKFVIKCVTIMRKDCHKFGCDYTSGNYKELYV
jgi:hypothetical protein